MIEVKTILNEQLLRKFNTAETRRRLWLPLVVATVLVAAGIACLFVKSLGWVCGVPILCLGVLVPVAYLVTTRILVNKMVAKSEAVKNQTTQLVRFSESVMINESNKYTAAQDTWLSYDQIRKVVEREEAFYMYVGDRVYLLDAKGFCMGARHDLHDVLRAKLGDRFRYQKRLYAKR